MHASERPMSSADHAWLRMDSPDNLVVIHLAFLFKGRIPLAAMRERLQASLLQHHQFTHRVQRGWLSARWVADADFHIDRHLHELTLTPGSSSEALKAWMSGEASRPLAEDRPLWLATLVQEVDGRSALVMRVHHSLADGVSLMELIGRMTELAPDAQCAAPMRTAERSALTPGMLLRRAPHALADALALIFMRRDRPSALKGQPQRHKSVAWSEPLSLAAAREIGRRHGATINDVMLAVISGALRRHLQLHGQARIEAPVRAVVPMNMRPRDEAQLLGNQFGLVGVELPVQLEDPLQRLLAVHEGMRRLKRGLQGQLALTLVRFAGLLPPSLQCGLLGIFSRRGTLIVTNVIGPAEARGVAGVGLNELMLCVPQGMTVGVGVSIISYAGAVRIGFLVDKDLMPECDAAAASIRDQFEQLRRSVVGVAAAREPQPTALLDGEMPAL